MDTDELLNSLLEEGEEPNKNVADVTEYIQEHFRPAADFNDADIYMDTREVKNKLGNHFGSISLDSLYKILKDLEFVQTNLPGKEIRPAWLIKIK